MSDQAAARKEGDQQRKPGDGCEESEDRSGGAAFVVQQPPPIPPAEDSNNSSDEDAAAASPHWSPNVGLLESITELGFNKVLAEKALFHTGNNSLDAAVNWIIDYGQNFDDGIPLDISKVRLESVDTAAAEANMLPQKMVFVVNNALKMGIGKIAAQVGHATLGLYRDMLERPGKEAALLQWSEQGETKVVLKADGGEQELLQLMNMAKQNELDTYLVADAGRTQVASGSITVLSVFGSTERVDEVTGKLKLLQ